MFAPVPGVLFTPPATGDLPPAEKAKGGPRISYTSGEPLRLLTKAVEDWYHKTGEHFEAGPDISSKRYSLRVGITHREMKNY